MTSLINDMEKMLVSGSETNESNLCDVEFEVGEDFETPVHYFAHKVILSSRCEVFNAMFRSKMKEHQENVVKVVWKQKHTKHKHNEKKKKKNTAGSKFQTQSIRICFGISVHCESQDRTGHRFRVIQGCRSICLARVETKLRRVYFPGDHH